MNATVRSPHQTGRRAARWTGAWFAALIAGVALTLAFLALIVASGGSLLWLGLAIGFVVIGSAAVFIGRRVVPRATTTIELPEPAKEDYSGLPAPSQVAPEEVPAAVGGLVVLATLFLFPIGLVVAITGAFSDSLPLVLFGMGISAVGPVMFACSLVFAR